MPEPPTRSAAIRILWVSAGIWALILGGIGVFLPLLPTTPFIILAAFCFGKGSKRLRNWLVTHRTFGPLITDWEMHGAIPRYAKILACTLMAATFLGSLLAGLAPMLLMIQAVFMGSAALYVLTRPSGPS
ncbi:MAG: YbaN family protein [Pseudomonadota bacterium]